MAEAQPSFDLKTWNALVQIDADIAAAASYLGQFGQRYVDDLADSYLAIGEKRYLAAIVAKIQRQAEDEPRPGARTDPETASDAGTANDNERTTPRRDPEFDIARWNELANEDQDIEAAIVAVGRFGSYYAADLAASYQAIDDKRYLRRIVDTIVAEAKADLARSPRPAAASVASAWDGRLETGAQRFDRAASPAQVDQNPASGEFPSAQAANSSNRIRTLGVAHSLALASLVVVLLVLAGTVTMMLYEYSIFRNAQGDADRLQAYENQCRICVFKHQAEAEGTTLNFLAAEREKVRRHDAAVAAEAKDFRESRGDFDELDRYLSVCEICAFADVAKEEMARLKRQTAENEAMRLRDAGIAEDQDKYLRARGDIDRLVVYLGACQDCLFKSAAETELNALRRQADIAEQARIAELQRQAQLRLPAAPANVPPRQVTWRIVNNSGLSIAVQFFSQTQFGRAWPGSNMSWPMTTGQTSDYNLACDAGEKICFGISAPFRTESWGVGGSGTQGCADCCYACDGAVHAINLAPLVQFTGESGE